MSNEHEEMSGGCMCGAIRYQVTGSPDRVLHCHCHSCRRHTGAAAATLAVFAPDQVRFSGTERKLFNSAPGVGRAFCPDCGSSLSWETTLGDEPICALHISTFDDPERLPANGHSFYGERISWFDIADDLPRHEGFVKETEPVCLGPMGKSSSD